MIIASSIFLAVVAVVVVVVVVVRNGIYEREIGLKLARNSVAPVAPSLDGATQKFPLLMNREGKLLWN